MIESIDRHLGALESDELLRLAGELATLREHPGWARLQELVVMERERVKDSTDMLIWARLSTGKGLEESASLTFAAGTIKGIGRQGEIIEKVLGLAVEVRQQLEREGT